MHESLQGVLREMMYFYRFKVTWCYKRALMCLDKARSGGLPYNPMILGEASQVQGQGGQIIKSLFPSLKIYKEEDM